MDDLDDHLLRLHCGEYVLAYGLLLDLITESLCYLIAYVGVQKGTTNVLHGFRDVYLGYLSFSLEDLERSLKSFA